MGFGHRVYRAEDPRARVLRRTAKELGAPALRGRRGAGEGRAGRAARPQARPGAGHQRRVLVGGGARLRRGARAHVHLDVHLRPDGRVERAHPGAEEAGPAGPPVGARTSGPAPRKPQDVEGWDEIPHGAVRDCCSCGLVRSRTACRRSGSRVMGGSRVTRAPERTRTWLRRPHPDSRRAQARRRPVRLRAEQGPARGGRGAGRGRHHATSAPRTGRRRCRTRSPGCGAGSPSCSRCPTATR